MVKSGQESIMEALPIRYTESGHLVGMLDRDQRTTSSLPGSSKFDEADFAYEARLISGYVSPKDTSCRRRSSALRWSTQRLKQVLVVVIHLLIVVPSVLSAPSGHKMADPAKSLIKEIYDQSKMNQNRAEDKFEAYTHMIFNMNSTQAHERFKNSTTFSWLPSREHIPKEYGSDEVDFSNRNMSEELVHLYSQFEKIRVAMEQVLEDEKHCVPNGEDQTFCKNFENMHADLKNFLAQLEVGIENLGLTKDESEATDRGFKDLEEDEAGRRKRSWAVYRDYINALDYTRKVFERFNKF